MVRSALLVGLAGSTFLATVSALPQPTSAARRSVPPPLGPSAVLSDKSHTDDGSAGLLRRQDVDCTQFCQSAQTSANGCNFDPTSGDATNLTPSQETCLCDGATNELALTACGACLFSHATPAGLDQGTAQVLIGLAETSVLSP